MGDAAPGASSKVDLGRLETWLHGQRLADLLPRGDLLTALKDLRADEAFWASLRPRFDRAWARGEARLRAEPRPLRALLTPLAVQRLLDASDALDPDPEALRAFLRSPAIEAMLGSVLYTGIFEFIKRVDIFGGLVNRLPVIGPIRQRLMGALREEVEQRLESQIKAFLGGFSGMAVERMIQFVLSEDNKDGFRKARRRLVEHVLDRPVASLVPSAAAAARWRDAAWGALREAAARDEPAWLDEAYRDHGAEPLGSWATKLPERGRALLQRTLDRFLAADAAAPPAA